MKNIHFISIMLAMLMVGCASNEQKAEKLIRADLEEILLDFDSYEPIKTTVKEAKQTMYNDTACRNKATVLKATMNVALEYAKQGESAKEHMDIWTPSHYSTKYARAQYAKYREEYINNMEKGQAAYDLAMVIGRELKKKIAALDTSKVIGWSVTHRFRCKNRGGDHTIGEFRYLIDSDFSKVIFSVDMEDDEEGIIEVLNHAASHEFEDAK